MPVQTQWADPDTFNSKKIFFSLALPSAFRSLKSTPQVRQCVSVCPLEWAARPSGHFFSSFCEAHWAAGRSMEFGAGVSRLCFDSQRPLDSRQTLISVSILTLKVFNFRVFLQKILGIPLCHATQARFTPRCICTFPHFVSRLSHAPQLSREREKKRYFFYLSFLKGSITAGMCVCRHIVITSSWIDSCALV